MQTLPAVGKPLSACLRNPLPCILSCPCLGEGAVGVRIPKPSAGDPNALGLKLPRKESVHGGFASFRFEDDEVEAITSLSPCL